LLPDTRIGMEFAVHSRDHLRVNRVNLFSPSKGSGVKQRIQYPRSLDMCLHLARGQVNIDSDFIGCHAVFVPNPVRAVLTTACWTFEE
jgi:hypothetical protein